MGRYSLKDGKITGELATKSYIKVASPARSASPLYLFVGTGSVLMYSAAKPALVTGTAAFTQGTAA